MVERKPISKRLRFQILARDRFRCRYCGRGANEVKLEIDHWKAVVGGGCNCHTNLVTACYDCNRGKGVMVIAALDGDEDVSDADIFYDVGNAAEQFEEVVREHFNDPTLDVRLYAMASILFRQDDHDTRFKLLWRADPADGSAKEKYLNWLRLEVLNYMRQVECPA